MRKSVFKSTGLSPKVKTRIPGKGLLSSFVAAGLIITSLSASAAIKNRYSFNEPTGSTTVTDSVSGSNGVVRVLSTTAGVLPTFDGSQVSLDGTGGYVDLPNGLVSGLTNVSIEMWVTYSSGGTWTRILDFGNNSNGEDTDGTKASGTGNNYMFLSVSSSGGGNPRFAITPVSNGNENPIIDANTPLTPGLESQLVLTYGPAGARMFIDGVQVASGNYNTPLSSVQDTNDWLGRSNWPDPFFGGSFNELRIHDTLLTQLQILASKAAGPNSVNYTPENPTSITLVVQTNMTAGTSQTPSIDAQFPTYGQVTLGAGDATFTSSDTNIVRIGNNNVLVAVAPGTATITASLGGKNSAADVTVIPPIVFTELKHRYSFNDAPDAGTVADSVGGALYDGLVYPPLTETNTPVVVSNGMASFPGGAYQTAGYIALPPNMLSTEFTNITVEFWTIWNGPAGGNTWARVFDFGGSAKGSDPHVNAGGHSYIMFTPRRSGGGARTEFRATADGGVTYSSTFNDQPASPGFPVGREVHVVATFAPGIGYSALYIDGIPVNITGTPLDPLSGMPVQFNQIEDPNMWLGVSQYADPPLDGKIDEMRLYEGVLNETQIALSQKAGPDALPIADPGALQSIALQTQAPLYVDNPVPTRAVLLGNYANVSGLEIIGFNGVKSQSTDTNIFTVTDNGNMTPRGVGTADLISSYGGFSATTSVSVLAPIAIHMDPFTTTAGSLAVTLPLFADFPGGITNVDVTAFANVTRSSSDTNLAVINNAGRVTYVGNAGTPTITSTYGGLTNDSTITIAALPARTLIHRYSFSEAKDATTVKDSVGTADGQVVDLQTGSSFYGNFTGTGQFVMGPGPFQDPPTTNSYINLPNRLVSTLSSVTVEGWFTWFGGSDNQRIFDFGISSAPDGSGGFLEDVIVNPGMSYFFVSPQTGRPRFAIKQGTGAETPSLQSPTTITITRSNESHFALVYDQPRGVVRLYINGIRANTAAATLPLSVVDDRNDWLGRSQWTDPYFNGSIDEFRIYDGPSSDGDIAADFAAGPDMNSQGQGPSLSVTVASGMVTLSWPASGNDAYSLQVSTSLSSPNWGSAGSKTQVGENYQVTVPIVPGGNAFYRLTK